MPNDPRVKFHKGGKICRKDLEYLKKHPECYGFITDSGLGRDGGSGQGGGSDVTPSVTPIRPPDPGPNPGPGPPGPGPGPEPAPKPGLTPAEIAGITIASVAAAAALAAAAERERQRRARAIPVPQDDIEMTGTRRGRFSLNRGGTVVPSQSRTLPKGISKAINSGFVSVDSSPASSASSSASSSPSVSGTSTPANRGRSGVPTPFEQAGYSAGIDLLASKPAAKVPLIAPDRMINPNAQGTAAEQLKELTRLQAEQGGAPPRPTRQTSLGTQVIDTQNELDISVRMIQMEAAGATEAEKLVEAQRMRAEYNQYLEYLDASTKDLELRMELEFQLESPLTLKSEIAELKRRYKALTGNDFQSLREQTRSRGIPRSIDMPSRPIGNTPTTDALNAAQPTSQPHSDPAARATTLASTADTITADLPDSSNTRVLGSIQEDMVDITLDVTPMRESRFQRVRRMFDRSRAQIQPTDYTAVRTRPSRTSAISEQELSDLDAMFQADLARAPTQGRSTTERISDLDATFRADMARAPAAATRRAPIKLSDFLAELGLSEHMAVLQIEGFDSVHAIGNYDINEANEMREALIKRGVPREDINRILEAAKGAPFGAETSRPISEAEALELAIKQSTLEAGRGYTRAGESSQGVTSEILRTEQQPSRPPIQPQETTAAPRTNRGKAKVSSEPPPSAYVDVRGSLPPPPAPAPAPADLIDLGERPTPLQPQETASGAAPRRPPPEDFGEEMENLRERPMPTPERPARPAPEPMGEELGSLAAQNHIVNFIEWYDAFMTKDLYAQGFVDPEIPPHIMAQGELAEKKYILDEAIKFVTAEGRQGILEQEVVRGQRVETGRKIPRAKMLRSVEKFYNKAIAQQASLPQPSAAAAETRATAAQEIRTGQQDLNRLVETQRASTRSAVPAPTPELTSRSARPTAAAPRPPTPPRPRPPAGSAPPSAPGSAPGSETATPRERALVEQTPAERAAFAEELTGRLKKGPVRQKAKINIGKTTKGTVNPLDIFVNPQFHNAPNMELNPRAISLRGTLTEISARVPRLVPSRSTLISMGAEGGSMIGGFAAGYFSAQAMNDYFAKHPAKNLGEQYGQALATTGVGMIVGSITQQVLSAAIRQGVNYALTGEMAAIEGAISGGGTLFLSSIGEAALFTLVGVTTQMATTKFLEDAGFNHAISRSAGSLASTYALAGTEVGLWIAKGGPLNPAGDISFLASEAMIIGFGIYSFVTEFFEGVKEDENEEEYQAQLAENERLNKERQQTIDNTIRRNDARQSFMRAYERADYDFDKALALLTPEQRIDLGENAEATDPNGLVAFRAQVEAAFDPLLDTTLPEGYKSDPTPLSREDQLKRDTYTAYVSWYIDFMNGKNPPPFDFNSEGAKLLNDESGGTWTSAANVHATTSMTMARRTNPLIENAQQQIVDAFHKDHKTIEEMPYDVVQYAELDPSFRDRYNLYIIAEAQTYIYQQYNNGGFRYDALDPNLVAIANRDPNFRGAVDMYYQVLANQARDYNLTIQECARLNALAANDQQIEIGKLNDARNLIIQRHQEENQGIVDRYNASIINEISAYGDNFEAIIRNINDQALFTRQTFLYATNRADLYRQLHMEMPELELVDPDTGEGGEGGEGGTDAPLPGPSKGRKIGDTDLYGYRYNLTDEQNQELDEKARLGGFSKSPTAMEAEAERIRYRDRYLFEDTDAEKAAKENLTLDEYYKKYGITAEQPIIEWEARLGVPKEDGRYRFPDGAIVTFKNGLRVDVDLSNVVAPTITKYDPSLGLNQPDGEIEMPDGVIRTYKNGLVTQVGYPANTPASELLTPDQINAKERATTPPTGTEPTYEQLQQQYPQTYSNLLRKYGNDPTGPEKIETALRKAHAAGFNETPEEKPPDPNRQPTLAELELMYPDELSTYQAEIRRKYPGDEQTLEMKSQQFLMKQYQQNPKPLPAPTPTTPITPTDPATLKQGDVTMPDGATRTYKNGKVVFVSYPANATRAPSPQEINEEEGVRGLDWTPQAQAPTPVEPVVDRNTLLQGRVTAPDGSTRTYIDGKAISVQYPEGKTGPNINEINASEGVQPAKDPNARPKDFMDRFLEEQEQKLKAKNDAAAAASATAEAENPEPEVYVNPGANPRYIASRQEQQNALNQTRANDAAGINNMNNEPENP